VYASSTLFSAAHSRICLPWWGLKLSRMKCSRVPGGNSERIYRQNSKNSTRVLRFLMCP
jgi:hypothetical protein